MLTYQNRRRKDRSDLNMEVMFSIIIPVYNAEKYIDRCLGSIETQTYGNWEAILIDDDSQDTSWEKCMKWSEKDNRVKPVKQIHGGPGVARNRGIDMAEGEYLLFLDSDDWWDTILLETCKDAIIKYKADIILFDTKVHSKSGNSVPKRIVLEQGNVTCPDKNPEVLCRTTTLTNKCLKKTIFTNNKIRYPIHLLDEDDEILPLVMSYGRRIVQLKGIYYHYDRTNEMSTSNSLKAGRIEHASEILIKSLDNMAKLLEERGFMEKYRKYYGRYILLKEKPTLPYIDGCELEQRLCRQYPELTFAVKAKFLVFGSYNLRGAVNYSVLNQENVKHFQFSSLIAAMSPMLSDDIVVKVKHPYRNQMLEAEWKREFYECLAWDIYYDYICIDFLEERYDVIKPAEGYATVSDAFLESSDIEKFAVYPVYSRISETVFKVWKEACDRLISLLKEKIDFSHVILVRSFLTEWYGEYGREQQFDNWEEIRKINEILERQYTYFEEHAPGIKVIDMEGIPENFSDVQFKHGCAPHHMNEAYYYTLSDKIGDYIGGQIKS